MSGFEALDATDRPLAGMLVLDFSQFLAGPVAAMRLADLGARVIKIERPNGGDIGRTLAFAGLELDGDTISFHAMNRNKESVTADLKSEPDLRWVLELIGRADVVIENFRPGVMERLGLGYERLAALNPGLVYAAGSGYGPRGPWRDRPGQDLLAQAITGLPWLNGSAGDPPIPFGIAVADHLMSCHLATGVVSLLLRRERTGRGGRVDTSLLESLLDLQFELLTAKLHDPELTVRRGATESAHAFLGAPYGLFATADGYLAIAMTPLAKLAELIDAPVHAGIAGDVDSLGDRDRLNTTIAELLARKSTSEWLRVFDAADVWCAPVLDLDELLTHEGFEAIEMVQEVSRGTGAENVRLRTLRSPLRIDGAALTGGPAAPRLGEHDLTVRTSERQLP